MEDDANDLATQMRSAIGRVYRRFRSERGDGELGDAAISALNRLRRAGAQGLTDLSSYARVTPGSMSQTVNRLTAGGLVERRPDPDDGRKVLFEATAEGERVGFASVATSMVWLEAALSDLDDHERAVLAEAAQILQRMAARP